MRGDTRKSPTCRDYLTVGFVVLSCTRRQARQMGLLAWGASHHLPVAVERYQAPRTDANGPLNGWLGRPAAPAVPQPAPAASTSNACHPPSLRVTHHHARAPLSVLVLPHPLRLSAVSPVHHSFHDHGNMSVPEEKSGLQCWRWQTQTCPPPWAEGPASFYQRRPWSTHQ